MQKLTLRSHHLEHGARLRQVDGAEVVADYGDLAAEVRAVRESAGLSDRSYRGLLRLTGPDRVSFLQGQTTNNVASLPPGHGVYTTFLTGKGKMRGDGVVLAGEEHLDIVCGGDAARVIREHLSSFIIMDDVAIEERGLRTVQLGLYGPRALDFARKLLDVPTVVLAPYRHRETALDGTSVTLVGASLGAIPGVELLVADEGATDLFERLDRELRPVGYDAVETLRIEAGVPSWGSELDQDTIPIEAGLGAAIDYEKGCFTGYEVLARIRTYGHVNRHLAGLRLASEVSPGAEVSDGAKACGRVTSVAYSEAIGGWLGLAMIRREVARAGIALRVAGGTGAENGRSSVGATVAALPFARESS